MTAFQTNCILHGDCTRILPQLPARSAHFILTDPPYLTRYRPRDGRTVAGDDNDAWLKPAFAEMYRVLADCSFCVSFYGWPHADLFLTAWRAAGFRPVGHFAFPKRYTSSRGYVRCQHECAYLLAKGFPREPEHAPGDVLDWTNTGNKLHPTQKPVSVLLPLVEAYSPAGGLVLDPFAGSGSTLVAAKMAGCSYLGIELDAGYCDIAARRLAGESQASLARGFF
jgi:DNA modification methylase